MLCTYYNFWPRKLAFTLKGQWREMNFWPSHPIYEDDLGSNYFSVLVGKSPKLTQVYVHRRILLLRLKLNKIYPKSTNIKKLLWRLANGSTPILEKFFYIAPKNKSIPLSMCLKVNKICPKSTNIEKSLWRLANGLNTNNRTISFLPSSRK
jgi:hypothetical protein